MLRLTKKMNKKSLAIIIALVVAILLIVIGLVTSQSSRRTYDNNFVKKSNQGGANESANWKIFKDSFERFQFKHPNDWVVTVMTREPAAFDSHKLSPVDRANCENQENSADQCNNAIYFGVMPISEDIKINNLDELKSFAFSQFGWPNVDAMDNFSQTMVDGRQAYRFSLVNQLVGVKNDFVWIPFDGNSILSFMALNLNDNELVIFEKVFDSVKFIN